MKRIIISFFFCAVPTMIFAQLKVDSTGAVSIGRENAASNTLLTIGDNNLSPTTGYTGISSLLHAHNLSTGKKSFGLYSYINGYSPANAPTIGTFSYASFGKSGKMYGIIGCVNSDQNGIGVYGTAGGYGSLYGETVSSSYAGYFAGPTYIYGTCTATEVVTPSDITLQENIMSIGDEEKGKGCSTLDNMMNLTVIKYTNKPKEYNDKFDEMEFYEDEVQAARAVEIAKERIREMADQKHYGLSAQELQNAYPDLVRKGENGILSINYVELVPILIRSIQELKQELDKVKDNGGLRMTRSAFNSNDDVQPSTQNVLYQNTPNPFKERTNIRFRLADEAKDAAICIFDMTGKMLRKLPVSSGETSVSINGWELGEGMFLYTLIVNGREIDTKRMIITK